MDKKITEGDVKAGASAAIAATQKATEAKKAADDAGGVDEALNKASQDAAQAAAQAESDATALSQKFTDQQKSITKMRVKRADIDRTLRDLGEDVDDNDEDDDPNDPNRTVTVGELNRRTADQLADAAGDATESAAIKEVLRTQVNPTLVTSNPQKAFEAAQAIVNRDRNAKVLEEHARGKGNGNGQRPRGAGAPPRQDEVFEPTAEESKYMRPPFSLSEADIKAARARGEKLG